MGLYDRDYTQSNYEPGHGYRPPVRFSMPPLSPVVKWLLIINVSAFVATFILKPLDNFALEWLSVYPLTAFRSLQLWRLITYQFLHDTGGLGHIFFNMLILYFFGVLLERAWGSRKFLSFYLMCGAAGGVLYPVLTHLGWLYKIPLPLIGASGAILGVIAACAVLAPNMRVYVFGIFPMKLAVLALVIAGVAVLTLLRPNQFNNAGGEAAHLAGLVTGAIYVFTESWRAGLRGKVLHSVHQKRAQTHRNLQTELDAILEKVHTEGLHSLTRREKNTLKKATETERRQNS